MKRKHRRKARFTLSLPHGYSFTAKGVIVIDCPERFMGHDQGWIERRTLKKAWDKLVSMPKGSVLLVERRVGRNKYKERYYFNDKDTKLEYKKHFDELDEKETNNALLQ